MAGVSATVTMQPPLKRVLQELRITPEQVDRNNKRALTAMGAWMTREMRNTMQPSGSQGQPGGDKWKALNPDYQAFKASEGRSTHIGIYKGRMQNSLSFDVRKSQLEVEAGPTVEHAESFNKTRPLTPAESHAGKRFEQIVIDAWDGKTL